MTDVIDFLERLGQDATLRRAAPVKKDAQAA
jgi:hypothetical protein